MHPIEEIFLLLSFAAFGTACGVGGVCEFINAIKSRHPEKAMRMIERGEIREENVNEPYGHGGNRGNCRELTALHAALDANYENVAVALIRVGADVLKADACCKSSRTPLHKASGARMKACVKAIVDREEVDSAYLEARDGDELTALYASVYAAAGTAEEDADTVKILLDAGCDPDGHRYDGQETDLRPLHAAALNLNAAIADLLLQRDADVDARCYIDDEPMTPLDMALAATEDIDSISRQKAFVKVLLNNGASETGKSSAESVMEIFWNPAYQWLKSEKFRTTDQCILELVEAVAVNSVFDLIATIWKLFWNSGGDSKILEKEMTNLATKYDEEGIFALYRLLRMRPAYYVEEDVSELENRKDQISRYVRIQGCFHRNRWNERYNAWKIDLISWNVALASHNLNVDVEKAKDIAKNLFLKSP